MNSDSFETRRIEGLNGGTKTFDKAKYLDEFTDATKSANAIANRSSLNSNLGKHIEPPAGAVNLEAHHLIPVNILSDAGEAGRIARGF